LSKSATINIDGNTNADYPNMALYGCNNTIRFYNVTPQNISTIYPISHEEDPRLLTLGSVSSPSDPINGWSGQILPAGDYYIFHLAECHTTGYFHPLSGFDPTFSGSANSRLHINFSP
jgi:hypothetical protein